MCIIDIMIKIRDLNLSFANNTIFRNHNFNILKGEKKLLYKESGAGKTTLLRVIQGLAIPDSGFIEVDNLYLNSKTLSEIRNRIFYLDQDVSLPELKIPNLLQTINQYKFNKERDISLENFKEYCEILKLNKGTIEKNINELSGGERQRVGLIIGFLLKKPIWLLDEPTSALDKNLKTKISDMIMSLENTTLLVISHDDVWMELNKLSWEV